MAGLLIGKQDAHLQCPGASPSSTGLFCHSRRVQEQSEHHQGNGRTSDLAGSSASPPPPPQAEPPQQDSTLTVVFRWPKGLGGNEVSFVGERLSTFDAEQDGGLSQVDMRTTANAGSFDNWWQTLCWGGLLATLCAVCPCHRGRIR